MAKTIGYVYGTALEPGVSANRRLYTAQHLADAVKRAQPRISEGALLAQDMDAVDQGNPISTLTHHEAKDNSEKIVGRVDSLTLDDTGRMKYKIAIPNTISGRTMLELADTSDGNKPFIRGMSIRGAWIGKVRQVQAPDGKMAETGDFLDIDGIDFTRTPGVAGALIDRVERVGSFTAESAPGRTPIFESVQEARVTFTEAAEDNMVPGCDGSCCADCGVNAKSATESVVEKGAAALKSGKPATPQTKAKNYADPGYQDDKMKRYALDSAQQVRAAWSYVNMPKNASKYTPAQLKRIKGRIKAAAAKVGIKISEGWLVMPAEQVTETTVAEYADMPGNGGGSFRIELTNGPVCLSLSSYCIDPADLEVIGVAAMHGAVNALKELDPDLDADIDVPGADAEDTDNDSSETAVDGNDVVESAAEPVAETTEKEPDMSEPTPAAAEQTPAVPATVPAPDAVQGATVEAPTPAATAPTAPLTWALTDAQFQQMLARMSPAVVEQPEPVGAGAATESAQAAPNGATQQVTETEDQRLARLVAEGIKAALPAAVQEHVERNGPPTRKGLVEHRAQTAASAGAADSEYPENWPSDEHGQPLEPHKMSREQWLKVSRPMVEQAVMKQHSVYRDAS